MPTKHNKNMSHQRRLLDPTMKCHCTSVVSKRLRYGRGFFHTPKRLLITLSLRVFCALGSDPQGLGSRAEGSNYFLRRQKPPNRSYKVFSRTGFGGLRPKEQKNLQGAKKQPNRPYKVFSLPGFGGLKPKEQKNKET